MLKASVTLALLGLLLLVISFLPLQVGTASNTETPALTRAEKVAEGRALFLAKGCVTCHRHEDAAPPSSSIKIGPPLTHYEPDQAFVRRWLRDPQTIRPGTMMPNLALSDSEIEALIAFLQE